MKLTMEDLVNYCKTYGFIFPGSDIYGGLANSWDYGPLGCELKQNIRRLWWQKFIQESPYNYGIDSTIILNPKIWEASGHVANFSDPLVDCRKCQNRYQVAKLIETASNGKITGEGMTNEELDQCLEVNHIRCPKCDNYDWTKVRQFNLLFETYVGVTSEAKNQVYLRGETAQGIFINFLNVQRSMRLKLPFGIGQTGSAFRNEVTPGNFIFRMREFEQMELEFFCQPGTDEKWFKYWKDYCSNFLKTIGINPKNWRFRDHSKEELAFYSKATTDIEYLYPMGWGELWGIANRTDYDLKAHETHAKVDLKYLDPATNEKYLPFVIEPSVGLDRLWLAVICDGYTQEKINDQETRLVLKILPALAPIKLAVLPLVKKNHADLARTIYNDFSHHFNVSYDESGSIGRRYRRSDAIGTPYCLTVDDETLKNKTVTIRDRDTMTQIVLPLNQVISYLKSKIEI